MKFTASFERTTKSAELKKRLNTLGAKAVFVGIPAGSARQRQDKLLKMAGQIPGKSKSSRKKKEALEKAASQSITNAELLFIFSKGSPLRNQPPRPVLEPSIEANREPIAAELAAAAQATLRGNTGEATRRLQRAGVQGANAARGWFTDPRNGWPQNAVSTLRKKLGKLTGKRRRKALSIIDAINAVPMVGQNAALDELNTPGIDTGAMRKAITWLIKNEDQEASSEPPNEETADKREATSDATEARTGEGAGVSEASEDVASEVIGEAAEGLESLL